MQLVRIIGGHAQLPLCLPRMPQRAAEAQSVLLRLLLLLMPQCHLTINELKFVKLQRLRAASAEAAEDEA